MDNSFIYVMISAPLCIVIDYNDALFVSFDACNLKESTIRIIDGSKRIQKCLFIVFYRFLVE